MFTPLLFLLVVAHARPIGPIPSIPVLHQQVNEVFETPLLTDLPNLSSPDDFDPSFTPSFPEPSLPIQPPFSPLPSLTPPQVTPTQSPPQFSSALVTPSSTPSSPTSSTPSPPTPSPPPFSNPSSTPSSTPSSSTSSTPSSSTSSLLPFSPTSAAPSSPPTSSTIPSTAPSSQSQPTSPLETVPNKANNSNNLKADKDAPATTEPLSTIGTNEALPSEMSPSSIPSMTPSPGIALPETPRASNETDSQTDSQPNPPTEPSLPPSLMDPLPSRSPLPPPISAQRTPCFPAAATVTLVNGSVIPMHRLDIGHVVHVGPGRYSTVHLFTHRIYHTLHEFVRLTTDSGRVLTLSEGHYVYVGNLLKPGREVLIGDCLPLGEGGFTCVNDVETVFERGLYNPQTGTGDIVVNGIKASVYTEAVKPALAHAALLPLRLAFSLFGVSTQCVEHGYPDFVPVNMRSLLAAR